MFRQTANRLRGIEDVFDGPLFGDGDDAPGLPKLIVIKGGLSDILHATIGSGRRLDAMPHERVDEFIDRAIDLACELGEDFVIVAGGPLIGRPRGFDDSGGGSGDADPNNA